MQKVLTYTILLVALAGVAFLVWSYAPRLEEPQVATSTSTALEMRIVEDSEDTAEYSIDIRYPQFGDEVVDDAVKRVVDQATAAFKLYPAERQEDSAIPKNEQSITFNSVYTGSDYVSVELMIAEYTGGAHPNSILIGVNVNRSTGKEVSLDEALTLIGKDLASVAAQTRAELSAKLGDAFFPEGAVALSDNYATFLIGREEVTFIFNNYQVAPYAAGPQQISFERVK